MPEQLQRDTKDTPLRRDIRALGDALGRAIQQHSRPAAFETEERLRLGCRRLRDCYELLLNATPEEALYLREEIAALDGEMTRIVDACDLETAIDVIRAFTVYFHLVNTAEQHHRTRRRRVYETAGESNIQRGSLAAFVALLQRNHIDADAVQTLLNRLSIELVFTAHPTEATRRSLILKSSRLAELLAEYDLFDVKTPREQAQWRREIEHIVTLLWRTDSLLHVRLQPLDEIKMGLYYLEEILYDAIPELYAELEDLLSTHYPGVSFSVPPFLRVGSWIGGDQDGNPHVKPDTLLQALRLQRTRIIEHYRASIEKLAQEYSQSLSYCAITPALAASIAHDAALMPDYDRELGSQITQEPYRRKLSFMWKRLEANLAQSQDRPGHAQESTVHAYASYSQSEELLADLELLLDSLQADAESEVTKGRLTTLIRQAQVFGFYFAALDVRQHSDRHASALAELLQATGLLHGDYRSLEEAERVRVLEDLLRDPRVLPRRQHQLSDETRHVLETFDAIRLARTECGERSVTCCVISMSRSLSDLLEAQFFCKEAGIVGLPIVPLFETIDDLRACAQILESAFTHPLYRDHLRACSMSQQVMLGYSDSSKDGGILTSGWELYQAQCRLAKLGERHGIEITIFHGRGGAIGRGGGPIYEAILGQPPGTVNGRIRITEQGEMLSFKYGLREIAQRNLELVVAGVAQSSLTREQLEQEVDRPALASGAWEKIMTTLSARAYTHYRRLIYETPEFMRFFEQATPILELGWLNIGSRPARRAQGRSIEELRAIPWVFSWMQSRFVLPSWYGVGAALEEFVAGQPERLAELRRMYRAWPFLRVFLDNMQMTLSKADMPIAQHYAALVDDEELRQRLTRLILEEYERTRLLLLEIVESRELLDSAPAIQRSIRLRNPYVDPLSHFQVALLRRLRALGGPLILDERMRDSASEEDRTRAHLTYAVLLTVNGIAAGLRNTG